MVGMGVITAQGGELKEMTGSYVNGRNGQVCQVAGGTAYAKAPGRPCWASSRHSRGDTTGDHAGQAQGTARVTPPEYSRAAEAEDECREGGWGWTGRSHQPCKVS